MKEVKYFHVILDKKLMWKMRVKNMAKKEMKTLWSGYAFMGRT